MEEKNDDAVVQLVKAGKLSASALDTYKDEHAVSADQIYAEMFETRDQYPELLKLFKLSLLITPSTANVERGFSVLTLLHTKQRNSLAVASLDKLRIILLGPEKFDDATYEALVDDFRDSADRRIDL